MNIRYLVLSSLILCVLMIAAYDTVVRQGLAPSIPDSQWSANTVWAQRYLYDEQGPSRIVIVGTSLAQRIRNAWLPRQTINIAMSGQSSFDGLEIIDRSGKRPDLVLIETNVLYKDADQGFLDGLFNPALFRIRAWLPSLREEHRPIPEFKTWLGRTLKAVHSPGGPAKDGPKTNGNEAVRRVGADTARGGRDDRRRAVAVEALRRHQKAYARPIDGTVIQARLGRLREIVGRLERRGTRIVFFEMPTHPSLCESPRLRGIREAVQRAFPGHAYLRDRHCERYRVTDGLHLDTPSAALFGRLLFRNLLRRGWLPRSVAGRTG